jgi:hypothetical protein
MVIAASMNCPDCGNPVEKQAQYCPKCFARIEPPTFWRKLLWFFQSTGEPRQPIINIKKTVSVNTTDEDGQHHEYHSLDEVPLELRKEIEELESEGLKETFRSSSSDGLTTEIISRKTASLFKVKDGEGNERTYHSLEELPPDIRAAFEQAQKEKTNE